MNICEAFMKAQELEKVTGKLRELVELSANEPQIIYDGDRPVRVMINYLTLVL